MENKFKTLIKKSANLGIDINKAFDRGISFFGLNVSFPKYKYGKLGYGGIPYCLSLNPISVLDVGSGGGKQAEIFYSNGADVTCVDFGTSIYAKDANKSEKIKTVHVNFLEWNETKKYNLVWASHVLEHQRNAGFFIEKLVSFCEPNGNVAISLPFPHRNLWGGHLSLWTPGLLVYNCVMCGYDLSKAKLIYGYREFILIFSPSKMKLPDDLSWDKGDITKLANFFPQNFKENADSWF